MARNSRAIKKRLGDTVGGVVPEKERPQESRRRKLKPLERRRRARRTNAATESLRVLMRGASRLKKTSEETLPMRDGRRRISARKPGNTASKSAESIEVTDYHGAMISEPVIPGRPRSLRLSDRSIHLSNFLIEKSIAGQARGMPGGRRSIPSISSAMRPKRAGSRRQMAKPFQRALRFEPYDPGAQDGDGDGIVQEGTPWERPADTHMFRKMTNGDLTEIGEGTTGLEPGGNWSMAEFGALERWSVETETDANGVIKPIRDADGQLKRRQRITEAERKTQDSSGKPIKVVWNVPAFSTVSEGDLRSLGTLQDITGNVSSAQKRTIRAGRGQARGGKVRKQYPNVTYNSLREDPEIGQLVVDMTERFVKRGRARGMSQQDAEDAARDAALRIVSRWDLFVEGEGDDLEGWMWKLYNNAVVDQNRANQAKKRAGNMAGGAVSLEAFTTQQREQLRISSMYGFEERDPTGRSALSQIWSDFTQGDPDYERLSDNPAGFDELVTPLVVRALADLPEEQRRALLASQVRGVSQADIARNEGISPDTVATRISRARDKIRKSLQKAMEDSGMKTVLEREGWEEDARRAIEDLLSRKPKGRGRGEVRQAGRMAAGEGKSLLRNYDRYSDWLSIKANVAGRATRGLKKK